MFFASKDEPQPYDLSNFSVLVVEDSHSMMELLSAMLKSFGVGEILVCNSAKEAQDLLTITQARVQSRHISGVDVVLTDWLMPGGSGLELINWVRAHNDEKIKFLPIIVISGYTSEKVIAMARDSGANEALVKPLSGKSLAQRITSVIEQPRAFLQTPNYFGPDRRRHETPIKFEDRRVIQPEEFTVHND